LDEILSCAGNMTHAAYNLYIVPIIKKR
jgi:hypothetical protein